MPRTFSNFFSTLLLSLSLIAIGGCLRTQDQPKKSNLNHQKATINLLEQRIEELEKLVGLNESQKSMAVSKTPTGPIKSMTFRLGTNDDRLRIYWADGSNSDLPCTKEQSIWVCG